MKSTTGIIRCIQPSRHTGRVYKGWQARVYSPSSSRQQRYFSDNEHGGARKAREAAEKWRWLMLRKSSTTNRKR